MLTFGKPSRGGYHNKEWAEKMKEVGLIPSNTGLPGGKQTGQRMTHFFTKNGAFQKAFLKMPEEYMLPFTTMLNEFERMKLISSVFEHQILRKL